MLYRSIHDKFFSRPNDTLVYPAHDYEGRFVSTIGQEKARNPRLKGNRSEEDFVKLMNDLDLPYPKKLDFSVPANELCGRCPDTLPPGVQAMCNMHDQGSTNWLFTGDGLPAELVPELRVGPEAAIQPVGRLLVSLQAEVVQPPRLSIYIKDL